MENISFCRNFYKKIEVINPLQMKLLSAPGWANACGVFRSSSAVQPPLLLYFAYTPGRYSSHAMKCRPSRSVSCGGEATHALCFFAAPDACARARFDHMNVGCADTFCVGAVHRKMMVGSIGQDFKPLRFAERREYVCRRRNQDGFLLCAMRK